MTGAARPDQPQSEFPHRVSERIGPGSVSVVRTGACTDEGLNERGTTVRIGPADEEILVDLSGLDPEDRTTLIDLLDKAIRRGCTVARSVEAVIELDLRIDGVEVV